jgi:hypothetical protein
MQKRVGHWAIVCVIRQLALIPHKVLSHRHAEPSTHTDRRLASLLLCLNTDGYLAQTLSHYRPHYVNGNDIPRLLSACKERGPLYTKDTAIEFHRLMVAVLLAYAAHLARDRVNQEDGPIVANNILLHAVVYSSAFKAHMKSLSAADPPVLYLPMSSHIQEYQQFADENRIKCRVPRGHRASSSGEGSSSSGEGNGKLGLAEQGESKEAATGGQNRDVEDEIVDATTESEIYVPPTGPVDLNTVIQSWLKLLVKYHTAQRTLENYCGNLGTDEDSHVDITRLSVKPKRGLMPAWGEITAILASVLASDSERPSATNYSITEPEETIEHLKAYVLDVANAGKSTDNIVEKFRDIIHGCPQPIGYTVHCEAALVAFASAKNGGFRDDRLAPLHKVRILWYGSFISFHPF